MTDSKASEKAPKVSQAEASSVTPPTVVSGLGYPADRKETSPTETGWRGVQTADSIRTSTEKVSRETSA